MNHFEDSLQISCASYCRLTLHPSVLWWHTPNGGKRNAREAGRLSAMGVRAGVPDFTFIWGAGDEFPRIGFVELKAPKGRLSDAQESFQSNAVEIGTGWAICRSLDEFIDVLKSWGVPAKANLPRKSERPQP